MYLLRCTVINFLEGQKNIAFTFKLFLTQHIFNGFHKYSPYRFLKTPERLSALMNARQILLLRDQRIARMKKKLESLTSVKGIAVDDDVQEEIREVISERTSEMESLPSSDFRRIFCEQQVCFFSEFNLYYYFFLLFS